MAGIREVLAGQLAISGQVPTEAECSGDPLVVDLDDHKFNGTVGFIPHHYTRYPLVNSAVPQMTEVETIARFATSVLLRGHRVIVVSTGPVPRAMVAARTLHLTVGGTIQGAIMAVSKVDARAFDTDAVLEVMVALGGGAR
jgi:hypothetical protein